MGFAAKNVSHRGHSVAPFGITMFPLKYHQGGFPCTTVRGYVRWAHHAQA
jgi:hypothetical protein